MANNAPDFASILDMDAGDIERPKPLPVGTYRCIIKTLPKYDVSSKKGTKYAEFTYHVLAPCADVDDDAVKEMGGVIGKTIRDTYYLTENALYRLKEMLLNCGIEEGKLSEMIEQTPNCQLLVNMKHTPSDDGTTVYANVAKTAHVDDEAEINEAA